MPTVDRYVLGESRFLLMVGSLTRSSLSEAVGHYYSQPTLEPQINKRRTRLNETNQ